MGRMQLKIADTDDFQSFGMARKACAPTGRAMSFYRLRLVSTLGEPQSVRYYDHVN